MTGPSGELIVVVLLHGNKMKRIKITPQQLWFSDTLDYDKDGDIDLKDWHLIMIDQ